MRIEEADQARSLVLTKSDGAVAFVAVGAVAGATVLGLNATTNVAAILAFTAAIFVALLTAYWTQRRLNQELSAADARLAKQLAEETKRQAQQLDAEQKRLELQLGFQRGETDRSELRGILDALAAHLFEMVDAAGPVRAAAIMVMEESEPSLLDWHLERLKGHRNRLDRETEPVALQMQRLSLRLGEEGEPLVRTVTRMRASAVALSHGMPSRLTAESLEETKTAVDELRDLARQFTELALAFTKAELHRSPRGG